MTAGKVAAFIKAPKHARWREVMAPLGEILVSHDLEPQIKWGQPCYASGGKNIVLFGPMSDAVAVLFFNGGLLKDPDGILVEIGPNSRLGKRILVESVQHLERIRASLDALIDEAKSVAASGATMPPAPEPAFADALAERLASDDTFREAFEDLTPGRRREYNMHIAGAKKYETRVTRVDRYAPKILDGLGMRD